MDDELKDLCQEVHERFPSWQIEDSKWFIKTGPQSPWSVSYAPISSMIGGNVPIYTSDYLLEKLLKVAPSVMLRMTSKNLVAVAWEPLNPYYETIESDTPLKSLLKLTIALDDAKLLTK